MLWQQLHRCLSSSLLPRIFLGKPGLLLSMDEGGDGSCVAMASAGTSHLGGENVGGGGGRLHLNATVKREYAFPVFLPDNHEGRECETNMPPSTPPPLHHRPSGRPTPFVYISIMHSWLLLVVDSAATTDAAAALFPARSENTLLSLPGDDAGQIAHPLSLSSPPSFSAFLERCC